MSRWAGSTGADPSPPAIRSMVWQDAAQAHDSFQHGAPRFHLKGYAGCIPLRLGGMLHRKRRNRNPPLPERPLHSVAGHVFRFKCFMGLLPRAREKEAEAAGRAVSNIWNPLQAGCSNFACSPAVDFFSNLALRTWGCNFGNCRPVFGQTISHRQWQQGNCETTSRHEKKPAFERLGALKATSTKCSRRVPCLLYIWNTPNISVWAIYLRVCMRQSCTRLLPRRHDAWQVMCVRAQIMCLQDTHLLQSAHSLAQCLEQYLHIRAPGSDAPVRCPASETITN